MCSYFTYPFGQKVMPVEQKSRTPKKVFVLGVYASAVHAKWLDPDGKLNVQALAVASEPYIFWRGDGVNDILDNITVPKECGSLLPANPKFNGPSGIILDKKFLAPLKIDRTDCWLADLLPESRLNLNQLKAIERKYVPFVTAGKVPKVTVPVVPKKFANDYRITELLEEFLQSKAEYLVTLGDVPLREFVSKFEPKWNRLASFGQILEQYGKIHVMSIERRKVGLIPLVHPRQAGRLGLSSQSWGKLHANWAANNISI